jgi:hypothetical protein
MSGLPPIATELMQRRELTRCAISDRTQRGKMRVYSITSSGASEQHGRHVVADCHGGLQVDDQLELRWEATGRSAAFSPLRMRPV